MDCGQSLLQTGGKCEVGEAGSCLEGQEEPDSAVCGTGRIFRSGLTLSV